MATTYPCQAVKLMRLSWFRHRLHLNLTSEGPPGTQMSSNPRLGQQKEQYPSLPLSRPLQNERSRPLRNCRMYRGCTSPSLWAMPDHVCKHRCAMHHAYESGKKPPRPLRHQHFQMNEIKGKIHCPSRHWSLTSRRQALATKSTTWTSR